MCGAPGWLHTEDSAEHYATGWVECAITEALVRAKTSYDNSPDGKRAAEKVKKGEPDQAAWRRWLYWPAGEPAPTYLPLD
jgi:hypothetical protein